MSHSGIQGLKRFEVRDLDGLQSSLLIGRTGSGSLVVGIAPLQGAAPYVVSEDGDQQVEILGLIGSIVRGDSL